ncbi:flagellar motor protein MotB [Acuticoccus sp. MNP-M23]|uniref:flagellar motor protein MotB n=1 Tax=Acuticoccus sp. MNP-M23 TaxID=3072793 RepID=UPI0028162919|nr:flagellar motor protein MotB [Acuticoccus sp. MNP-M23]WMS41785.1 flagellar motor protein MotB [Acuticoccus sp. MNP-M23]
MSRNDEIIVIRRPDEEAAAKKGGAWKVAHADFMTAMMAFFLIMWLVNATDEEIKKSIANYFNPMNLMAAPTSARGIMDPTDDATPPDTAEEDGQPSGNRPMGSATPGEKGSADGGGNVEEGNDRTMASAGRLEETDNAAFNDPYAALASAASDIDPEQPTSVDTPDSTLGTEGATAQTDNARDPFDPAYWQTVQSRPSQTLRPGRSGSADAPPEGAIVDAGDATPRGEEAEPGPGAYASAEDGAGGTEAAARRAAEAMVAITQPAATKANSSQAPADSAAPTAQAEQAAAIGGAGPRSSLAEAILAEAQAMGGVSQDTARENVAGRTQTATQSAAEQARQAIQKALSDVDADISVTAGARAVLISLTDGNAFSMFPIGSSDPTLEATGLFQRVGNVLAARDGTIVVRGHTDARPFRGGTSDNWTLSFQRAHATKNALVDGGVPEQRFARVEGLADREPARPDDPLSDENRRIEILYEPSEGIQ